MLSDAECSVFYNRVRRDVEEGFYVKEDILLLLKEMAEKVKGGGDGKGGGSWVIQEKQVIIPVKQRSLVCVECTHRFEDPCPPCKWKGEEEKGL